jgi:hypothetical protein
MVNLAGNNSSSISVSPPTGQTPLQERVRAALWMNARKGETPPTAANRFQKVGMAPDEFCENDTVHCNKVE